MADQLPDTPEIEPLTRTQVLIAMGVTAVVLLLVSKLWLHFSDAFLLTFRWRPVDFCVGAAIGLGITLLSSLVYRLWEAYREGADFYLDLVLKPLALPDLLWLGLLPGLSEELLFRGVMLPDLGFNWLGLVISSLCFGVLHLGSFRQWAYVSWVTVVGLILGYGAIASGNLLVPVVAHVVANWISGYSWKLGHRDQA